MCHGVRVAFLDDKACFAVVNDFWDSAVICANDRLATRGGFFCDEDARFAVAIFSDDARAEQNFGSFHFFKDFILRKI